MRRVNSALSAGFVAAGMAVAVSVFGVSAGALTPGGEVETAGRAQYYGEDHAPAQAPAAPPQNAAPAPPPDGPAVHFEVEVPENRYYDFYARWLARKGSLPAKGSVPAVSEAEGSSAGDTPSEGSDPGARAPAEALSLMSPPVPYSQVVDNASPGRFRSARDWNVSGKILREAPRYDADYRYVRPAMDAPPARFRVKIPAAGHYTVYARWPAARGHNPATRFRVSTASGPKKVEVNQRKDGGVWVRLGAYEMEAGDRYSVWVAGRSGARGRIVADAVRVVGGTQAPPQARAGKDGEVEEATGSGKAATGGDVVGAEVVERARTHLGTPYRHSPPLPCKAYRSEDCSCLTSLVFSRWLPLPDNPIEQWSAGRSVEKSDLRPGDLVFFKEAGERYPITHVAIYSGSGNIIHASTYWGQVVERPMQYVKGYLGAKRLS